MARPQKLTLDWFMHDKDARNDRKIKRVTRKWQAQGYALYFMLLEMLIAEDGMRLSLADPAEAEIVADETFCRDTHHLLAMITSMVEAGLFDRGWWESERVVFSPALHRRYEEKIQYRKSAAVRKARSRAAKEEIAANYDARLQQLSDSVANTRADLSSDPDLDLENKKSETRNQKQESIYTYRVTKDILGQPCDNPVVTRDNEEDKQALQFRKRPWRKEGGRIDNDFLEFVGKQLPQNGGEHPKTKGRSHILNLERSGPWEKLEGYWEDYQDSAAAQTKPAPQPVAAAAMPKVGSPDYNAQLRALAAKRAGIELPPPTEKT